MFHCLSEDLATALTTRGLEISFHPRRICSYLFIAILGGAAAAVVAAVITVVT